MKATEMSDAPSTPTTQSAQEPLALGTAAGAHVIAVTSGKGGVGKTFISANLAAALTRHGLKVLVLDADLGLANLDVVLNLHPKITLHDVFTGRASLEEAVIEAPGGFSVLLAGSGMVEYSRLTPEVRNQFINVLQTLTPRFDVVLLDTGTGISDVVLFSVSLAAEVLIVATPEPTSLTDAYAAIKVLATQQKRQHLRLVVNQAARAGDGRCRRQARRRRPRRPGQATRGRLAGSAGLPALQAARAAGREPHDGLADVPVFRRGWPAG